MALELRGRLQPRARRSFKHLRRLIDRPRKSDVHENDLGHTRIAIALQIVYRGRFEARRYDDLDVRELTAIRLEQAFQFSDFGGRFVGRETESEPSVAIVGNAAQCRTAFAA